MVSNRPRLLFCNDGDIEDFLVRLGGCGSCWQLLTSLLQKDSSGLGLKLTASWAVPT